MKIFNFVIDHDIEYTLVGTIRAKNRSKAIDLLIKEYSELGFVIDNKVEFQQTLKLNEIKLNNPEQVLTIAWVKQ